MNNATLSLLVGIFITLTFTPSIALTNETKLLKLDDYIEYSLKNSASLKAAFQSYIAATHESPQVSALPDPKLTYGYFIESIETRVGPQEHKVGIAQSFPWFGTLSLKGAIADAEARAEYYRFLSLKNQIVFRVSQAYTELAYAKAAIQITKDTIELVSSWENILQERFRTGSGSHSDLIRVQLELGKLEERLAEFQDLVIPLKNSLNALLNRSPDTRVETTTDFLSKGTSFQISKTITKASQINLNTENPEVLMLTAAIEAKKAGVKLAEKKFYPNFTLGVNYIATGNRDVAGGGDDSINSMLTLSLPVFWKKNKAAISQARAKKKSFEQMKEERKFSLSSELSRSLYELRDSKRKIVLYKKTLIPKTEESIEASYTAYEAGESGFLDVIDSEERLLEFQLSLKRTQADQLISLGKLHMLAGNFSSFESIDKEKPNDR